MHTTKIQDMLKPLAESLIDDANDEIIDFLMKQPYRAYCKECGQYLECDTEVDHDGDMTLRVSRCTCEA